MSSDEESNENVNLPDDEDTKMDGSTEEEKSETYLTIRTQKMTRKAMRPRTITLTETLTWKKTMTRKAMRPKTNVTPTKTLTPTRMRKKRAKLQRKNVLTVTCLIILTQTRKRNVVARSLEVSQDLPIVTRVGGEAKRTRKRLQVDQRVGVETHQAPSIMRRPELLPLIGAAVEVFMFNLK